MQGKDSTTVLKYPPAIIFKSNGKCNVKFDGLDEGLVMVVKNRTVSQYNLKTTRTYARLRFHRL